MYTGPYYTRGLITMGYSDIGIVATKPCAVVYVLTVLFSVLIDSVRPIFMRFTDIGIDRYICIGIGRVISVEQAL